MTCVSREGSGHPLTLPTTAFTLSLNSPTCQFILPHQDFPDGHLQIAVSNFAAVPQHRDFSSARAGGAGEMQAVLQCDLLCRVCALHRVLPRGKDNLPGCASTTFLGCAGDTGVLVQQPGSGQWRALSDIHTNTHTNTQTLHGKRGKKIKTMTAERASFPTAACRTSPNTLTLICPH